MRERGGGRKGERDGGKEGGREGLKGARRGGREGGWKERGRKGRWVRAGEWVRGREEATEMVQLAPQRTNQRIV